MEKQKTSDDGNEVHKMSISVDDGRESVGEYVEKKNEEREGKKGIGDLMPKEDAAEKDKQRLKEGLQLVGNVKHFVPMVLGGGIAKVVADYLKNGFDD